MGSEDFDKALAVAAESLTTCLLCEGARAYLGTFFVEPGLEEEVWPQKFTPKPGRGRVMFYAVCERCYDDLGPEDLALRVEEEMRRRTAANS